MAFFMSLGERGWRDMKPLGRGKGEVEKMMTHKQRDLLAFIHKRLEKSGVPPSFDEMRIALGLKSKSGIHRLITALEERGYLRRLPHRARALEIIKLPEGLASPAGEAAGDHALAGEMMGAKTGAEGALNVDHASQSQIPLMGRIAAGVPIEAIQQNANDISVPPNMIGSGAHYALEVQGDSMIEAGIFDGDFVVIKEQPVADNGDIVVALIDEEEATLKRLRRKGNSIALEAANPSYETRLFRADQVRILGRLVGLLRNY